MGLCSYCLVIVSAAADGSLNSRTQLEIVFCPRVGQSEYPASATSQPLSPVTTQHSLPSGRYPLLGPDFHRLDRTSLRLAHSFDHLVCPQQESLPDCYAERLCSCKIDDQLESGRLFDRKVGRLCPLQNLVDEVGCTPEQVGRLGSVRHKASRSKKLTESVSRGESRAQSQCVDTRDIRVYQCIRAHIKWPAPRS